MLKDNPAHNQRGTVLIITIWIMIVLAAMAIVFGQFVRVEAIAARNNKAAIQCEYIAEGAINYVISQIHIQQEPSGITYQANPFEAVPLGDGYFWVLRPNIADERNYDFGISDHAGRINLNTATLEMLLKLPSMTSELANSIIDWRSSQEQASMAGAGSEYYLLLEQPYWCKNARLETVEEVFLIKGASTEIVFGADLNRNGVVDWNEGVNDTSSYRGNTQQGFYNYVTVYSYENNLDIDGQRRVNVNNVEQQDRLASIIEDVIGDRYFEVMNRIRRRSNYSNLIDLYYTTQMNIDEFSQIIDSITTTDDEVLHGLININTAPAEVLICLPSLEPSDVEAIVSRRNQGGEQIDNILWITEVLDEEKAVAIGQFITTKSFQYSADIIAASNRGSAFKRYYAVIDTAQDMNEVILKQSLSKLGWPLDQKILQNLRDNNTIE